MRIAGAKWITGGQELVRVISTDQHMANDESYTGFSKFLPYLWLPSAVRSCSGQLRIPIGPQTRSWSRSPGTHRWPLWNSWCWEEKCGTQSSVLSLTIRWSLLGKQVGNVPTSVASEPFTFTWQTATLQELAKTDRTRKWNSSFWKICDRLGLICPSWMDMSDMAF